MTTFKLNPNTLYQATYQGAPTPDSVPTQTQVTAIQGTAAAALPLTTYPSAPTVSGPFSGKPIIQMTNRNGGAFGLGSGPVPITLTLPVAVAYLEYQVVDATSGAVIEAWQPYVGSVRPGTQTIRPIVSTRLGWNFIQLRANGVVGSVAISTVPFGVGDIILGWGQSLMVTKMSTYITSDPATIASLGITISPYCSMFCSYAQDGGSNVNYPPTWAPPADGGPYNSAFAAQFLSLLVAKAGYNIGFAGYGVGSSAITEWLPGATGSLVHLPTLLALIKLGVTGWAIEIREQGHAEAKLATPSALYLQQDMTVRNALELVNPIRARTILQTIPALGSYSPATPATVMAVRSSLKQLSATDQSVEYVDDLNATLWSDQVHPSQAGGVLSAQNCYRAVARLLGLMPVGSVGPYINGSLTRISNAPTTITIPVQQRGGTALVGIGTLTNQFQVFLASDAAFANPLSVTGVALAASSITLTLASDPGVGVALNVLYRPGTFDISSSFTGSGIYDDHVDSDGLATGRQLNDPGYALPVPGTISALTVNTPASTTSGAPITLSGSYFGTAPIIPMITVNTPAATTAGAAITLTGSYSGGF